MGTTWAHDRRFNQALLASLALHLGLAMLIPAAVVLSGETSTIETISFVHIARVQITPPKPVPHEVRAVAPIVGPLTHATDAKSTSPRRALHVEKSTSLSNTAPIVGTQTQTGSVSGQTASIAPAATAAPQAAATSVATRERTGGYMPLGAEVPDPILDASVHDALVALKVQVTLVVTVDENGHTKHIEFQPPIDAAMETRISDILADAQWDPATCGAGLPCEAKATIKL